MNECQDLNSMKCGNCGKKIAEIKIKDGVVSIICPKCGTKNVQETKATENVKNVSGNS